MQQTVVLAAGVLERLLAVQMLDCHGVEAVHLLLQCLLRRCSAGQHGDVQHSCGRSTGQQVFATQEDGHQAHKHMQQLLGLDTGAACKVLREYLAAAAAKDCSIMITLAPITPGVEGLTSDGQPGLQENPCTGAMLHDGSLRRCSRYKVAFVDLDLKPLSKIAVHWQLEQAIMAAVEQEPDLA